MAARMRSFSPDSKLIAIGVRYFNKDNDTSWTTIHLFQAGHAGTGISEWQRSIPDWDKPVAFAPFQHSIAVLGGHKISFYDIKSGITENAIGWPDSTTKAATITPDGKQLFLSRIDRDGKGVIEVWNLGSGNADHGIRPR